jgi:hypothetical protein
MQISSTFCRAQETRQRALAAGATLVNVRGISTLAADAWAKEARAAEKREQRKARVHPIHVATLRLVLPSQDDRSFSENPDRGCADTAAAEPG